MNDGSRATDRGRPGRPTLPLRRSRRASKPPQSARDDGRLQCARDHSPGQPASVGPRRPCADALPLKSPFVAHESAQERGLAASAATACATASHILRAPSPAARRALPLRNNCLFGLTEMYRRTAES
jgi:hypothetical protein